jgi:hypothetical protein
MFKPKSVEDWNGVKHDPGCPAVADDEGDYEFLHDAGECVCGAIPIEGTLEEIDPVLQEKAREVARAWQNQRLVSLSEMSAQIRRNHTGCSQ